MYRRRLRTAKTLVLPESEYSAKLVGFNDGALAHGPVIYPVFQITSGIYQGELVVGMAKLPGKLTPRTKLRTWIESLLGRELTEDETVDLKSLVGTECYISLIVIKDSLGKQHNRISRIRPVRRLRNECSN